MKQQEKGVNGATNKGFAKTCKSALLKQRQRRS
jgi:hypothetical protein